MTSTKRLYVILLLLIGAVAWSCSRHPMKQYPMRGVVVRLDPATQTATIHNEKIEGWMEAMTMEFPVREKADWDKLAPGEQITATLFANDEKYYIADVRVIDKGTGAKP